MFVMTLCINIQAQIKVHESGQISLQDYTGIGISNNKRTFSS